MNWVDQEGIYKRCWPTPHISRASVMMWNTTSQIKVDPNQCFKRSWLHLSFGNMQPRSSLPMAFHPLTWQMRSPTPWLAEPSCPHCIAMHVGCLVSGYQAAQGTGCWNSFRRCAHHEVKGVSSIFKTNFQFLPLYMLMYSHRHLFIYLLFSL